MMEVEVAPIDGNNNHNHNNHSRGRRLTRDRDRDNDTHTRPLGSLSPSVEKAEAKKKAEDEQHRKQEEEEECGVPRKRFEPDLPQVNNFTAEEYEKYERLFWHSEFRKLIEMGDYEGALLRRKMMEQGLGQPEQLDESETDRWSNCENSSRSCSSERRIDMETEFDLDFWDEDERFYPNGLRAGKNYHPLLIPEILEHILSFLDCQGDRDTLENCSQVCQDWGRAVHDKLEHFANSDAAFKISSKLAKLGILENKEELHKTIPKYCQWFNMKLPPKKPIIEKVFKNIGKQMKELDVSFKSKKQHIGKISSSSSSNSNSNSSVHKKNGRNLLLSASAPIPPKSYPDINKTNHNHNNNQNYTQNNQNNNESQNQNPGENSKENENDNNNGNEMETEIEMEKLGDYLEEFCPHLEILKLSKSAPAEVPITLFSHHEKNRHHFLPLKTLETSDFTEWDDARSGIFPQLISSSPLLESLSFDHESTELIVHVLSLLASQNSAQNTAHLVEKGLSTTTIFENGLSHLKSLEISHSDMSEEFIIFALKHRWSLRHLKIGFDPTVSIFKIRTLLTHLRYSLTSLNLTYKGKEEYESAFPIADNWVIPLSLRELKHLEISPDIYPNACRFLVNALQLPNLKSLKLASTISWDENYFESMWNSNPLDSVDLTTKMNMLMMTHGRSRSRSFGGTCKNSRRRNLCCGSKANANIRRVSKAKGSLEKLCPWRWEEPTLERLELPCGLMDSTVFLQNPNPFRNLKELKCSCPSIKVIQTIFLRLGSLERLEINDLYRTTQNVWGDLVTRKDSQLNDSMPYSMKRRPILWDEVLTFKKRPDYTIMYKMSAEGLKEGEEHEPSIRNLTKLKFLQLHFKQLPRYEKLTDFAIYHGLSYLKQLQHIKINRHMFSEEAVEHLRQRICQFAHVDFEVENSESEPDLLGDFEL